MAKYNTAYVVLLNNGQNQILPVSKAQLIELASNQSQGQFGEGSKDVAAALTYLLNKSNNDLTAAKSYTTDAINGLDGYAAADSGYVLSYIVETDGVITKQNQVWLDASVVSYQGVGDGAPTTVQSAIEDIQETLADLAGDGEGSVQTQITTALDALNLAQVSENGKPITYVSQTNGQVAAGTGNIEAQYVDVDNTGNKFNIAGESPATTLSTQATLEQLQTEIEGLEDSAARYTLDTVTESVPNTVLTRYQLTQTVDAVSEKVGSFIDIPKDKSLVSVQLGHTDDSLSGEDSSTHESASSSIVSGSGADALVFVHQLANGNYKLTTIDVSSFLRESEFGNGLQVTNGVVSVKTTDADGFLSVDPTDGVKLSGVQDAINAAKTAAQTYTGTLIEGLDSEIAAKTENGFSYVMTGVTEADGKLTAATYISLDDSTVKTTPFTGEDLASLLGADIQNVTNIHDALNKIAGKVNNTQAGAVNNIVITDGSYIKATNASKDGNNTYSFTIDDSALGNVAKLQYDELTWENAETVTILGANPNE